MDHEKEITPLDKEALALLPGLRYARSLIDIAMQMSRHSAMRESVQKPAGDPSPTKQK
jgi:hypothetical protein